MLGNLWDVQFPHSHAALRLQALTLLPLHLSPSLFGFFFFFAFFLVLCSGFPKDPANAYSRFGFNLNVLPGVPESMLKYLEGISGISMPWLYAGMLFSSFCWHVEDNFLYSINYMHFGAGKRWYGVPSAHAHMLEAAFRKLLPDEFRHNPSLLHDLVTMVRDREIERTHTHTHTHTHTRTHSEAKRSGEDSRSIGQSLAVSK